MRSLANNEQASNKQSSPDPELEALLEADRLAIEQLFEAADSGLREALEAERLALEAILKPETWPAALFVDWPKAEPVQWPEPLDWPKFTSWPEPKA